MKGIIEVIGEVVEQAGKKYGKDINYLFGDSVYINNELTLQGKSEKTRIYKFPLIALFTSFSESRTDPDVFTSARVSLLIAVKAVSSDTNNTRLNESFIKQLRPIYKCFMGEFKKHPSIDVQYNGVIPHTYQENYNYGAKGAMDSQNKPLVDLIDAIDIGNLNIKLKKETCYGNKLQNMRGQIQV